MKLKVCVVGPKQSGKRKLSQLLTPTDRGFKRQENSQIPMPSTFRSEAQRIQLDVFDIPSESIYTDMKKIFLINTDVFIYCVDSSEELDLDRAASIKNECEALKRLSPNAQVVLVATKYDIALSSFSEKKIALKPFSLLPISTIESISEDDRQLSLLNCFVPTQRIKSLRNQFSNNTELCKKLKMLALDISHLPASMQMALTLEVEQFVTQALSPSQRDEALDIQAFEDRCNEILNGKQGKLLELVVSIVISVLMIALIGLVGFLIGFGLGAWSGPGAFLTGLAAGTSSAIAVATVAPCAGIATMGYCAHRFLKPTPLPQSLHAIGEEVQQLSRNEYAS